MPLMTHPESGQQRVVPGRARSSYEQRGWRLAGAPEVEKPATYDTKDLWIDYAESQGVDTDGLTKQEIIDTVGA